jgi:hypothetical protein
MEDIRTRGTTPFTIFYRTASGEGGFKCEACNLRRHDAFPRAADAFAVAAQHLNICRAALRHRPVEGVAYIDGATHGVVLRDGIMTLALDTTFDSASRPRRVAT